MLVKDIKIQTTSEEDCVEVQHMLFALGAAWNFVDQSIRHPHAKFLFVYGLDTITWSEDLAWFQKHPNREVSIEELRKMYLEEYHKMPMQVTPDTPVWIAVGTGNVYYTNPGSDLFVESTQGELLSTKGVVAELVDQSHQWGGLKKGSVVTMYGRRDVGRHAYVCGNEKQRPWIGHAFCFKILNVKGVVVPAKHRPKEEKAPVIKQGDRVQIAKTSKFFGQESAINPSGIDGEVVENKGGRMPYVVLWSNGVKNTYKGEDLVLCTEK